MKQSVTMTMEQLAKHDWYFTNDQKMVIRGVDHFTKKDVRIPVRVVHGRAPGVPLIKKPRELRKIEVSCEECDFNQLCDRQPRGKCYTTK